LERETASTIQNWFELVEQDAELTCVPLNRAARTRHLAKLFQDLILRLRLDSHLPALISLAARDHGKLRHQQGYTVPMLVEESRFLEVSIFSTLQRYSRHVDFSQVLLDVVTIADECDSQLGQAMLSYGPPTAVSDTRPHRHHKDAGPKEIIDMPKTKMTKPQEATLSRVKKEMDLPRVAMSARRSQVLKLFARNQAETD
jgi:hypothetical protein